MSNSIVGATALNKKEDDAKLKSATDNDDCVDSAMQISYKPFVAGTHLTKS